MSKSRAKLNPGVKQAWLQALRSGEYKRAQGQLRKYSEHCCLGVLCEVASLTRNTINCGYSLPGMETTEGLLGNFGSEFGLSKTTQNRLASMNDSGKSFLQIADWIEANL